MNTADMADEIARLRKERDELAAWRQDAVMALTGRGGPEQRYVVAYSLTSIATKASLARRDARMKAEALEEASRKLNEAHYGNAEVGFDDDLLEAEDMVAELASEYRKQAEGE